MPVFDASEFAGFERVERFPSKSGLALTKIRSAILELPRKN
jgi:hypothetical protein